MKNYLFKIFIAISIYVGTVLSFLLYLDRYLTESSALRNTITTLMEDISVAEERQDLFLIILSVIYCAIFWILGFVIYKIIFKIAKVKVRETRLILSLGTAYMLSYLLGYLLVGNMHSLLLTLLTNLTEMFIVFAGLYEYIKSKLPLCIGLRVLLVVINLCISI